MICAEFIMATQIILTLLEHEKLPQVVLPAKAELVTMTIKSFNLPWRVVRDGVTFTVVVHE